jgi:hypothetical protein
MAAELINELRNIRDKVNNLDLNDAKAIELENLIDQTINILGRLKNPRHDFFDSRRTSALRDLEYDKDRHMKGYWSAGNKVEKISEFSRARNEVKTVINQILSTFGR